VACLTAGTHTGHVRDTGQLAGARPVGKPLGGNGGTPTPAWYGSGLQAPNFRHLAAPLRRPRLGLRRPCAYCSCRILLLTPSRLHHGGDRGDIKDSDSFRWALRSAPFRPGRVSRQPAHRSTSAGIASSPRGPSCPKSRRDCGPLQFYHSGRAMIRAAVDCWHLRLPTIVRTGAGSRRI